MIQFDPILTDFLPQFSECFTCVACGKDLSHDEFVLDEQKTIYCTEDWAKKKAYRCVTCKRAIVPTEGQTKAPRLRALGKDYHPDCFKCEVCILDTIPTFFVQIWHETRSSHNTIFGTRKKVALMPCPFTGLKTFCAGPKFLS